LLSIPAAPAAGPAPRRAISTPTDTPAWLLRPLPANAVVDEALNQRVRELAAGLPGTFRQLYLALSQVRNFAEYDPAVNAATTAVWPHLDALIGSREERVRMDLVDFAASHLVGEAAGRVCRRLAKDPSSRVRRKVREVVEAGNFREVALPATKDGPWDATGWLKGTVDVDIKRHKTGKKVQAAHSVPPIPNLAALRELLGIRSPAQLGYFLLATDTGDGPYTKFSIPKRDGSDRTICAPKPQLKWVQRAILEKVLARVPAHDAAHGFVEGRSTVTNATVHRGAKVVVKLDLKDFFPTIHYFRVLGLFASLGYPVGNAKFGTDDKSAQIAPVLARLCCYTPDPQSWGTALVPQGAPTSPAISNLVCRRLDSRLLGLAKKAGGNYTRYADDLAFSFPTADGVDLGRFRWWVDQVCHQEGFLVHQQKFRVIRACQRQLVTGIVVNDELRVPREARRRFRAILHNCRTLGVASQAKGNPRFKEYLRGFASYVNMVSGDPSLLKEVADLLHAEKEREKGDDSGRD
jgi:retron-type reverse transcriptase